MLIPDDVKAWVRGVFRACNVATAQRLMAMPNTHEAALDQAFITEAAKFSAPTLLPSTWVVRIDTHFLGGGRHYYGWEIADIGVLIQFRRAGKVIKTKVLLLQSKRLYPTEQELEEDEPADYGIGFMRLYRGDTSYEHVAAPRRFRFEGRSRYEALKIKDEQYTAIEQYEAKYRLPVHYLLYHPGVVPFETEIPRMAEAPNLERPEIGARVLPAVDLRAALERKAKGSSPTYDDLKATAPTPAVEGSSPPGWLVEEFIADLAVDCKVGHVAEKQDDEGLHRIFNRRSGPISAAIAVTFDAPPGTGDG